MKFLQGFLLFSLIVAFSLATVGQSPSKILSQANKALGGEKALKAISSWQQTGKVTRLADGATGNYSAYAASGGLFGGLYDVNGFEIGFGYNGKSGWVRDSKNGLRTVTGEASRDFQAEAVYRASRWLRAKDEKTKISAGGKATIAERPANVVLLTTAKGSRIKLFFDAATGLLLRDETEIGDLVKIYEYGDYRRVGAVQMPFEIKYSEGDEKYDIRLDEVKFNQQIARSKFDFPVVSNEPLPNIPALLDEVRANADKVDAILENYSFTEERIERDLKDNGQLVVKESEKTLLTFYKGYRIKRTLEKNGKPLSPSDQAKEDKDVEKQVAEIEKKIAEREKKAEKMAAGSVGQPRGEGQRVTIAEALKGSLLVNPRRERFRGRDVIVFDYEPNPAFKPKSRMEQLFALCNGAVWVDTATKQIVRLEAQLTKSAGNFLAKASRGASFTLENDIVNNEIWLPSQADINLQIKLFLIAGININNLVKYGDYRRFETEVKDASVGDEKKP